MTTLNASMSTAMTLIQTVQVQTSVTASNIANADTDGYTRKTADQANTVYGGVGSGVTVTGVSSDIDPFLLKSITAAMTDTSYATVTGEYTEALAYLLGTTDGSVSTLTAGMDDLRTALSELSAMPESMTLKTEVVGQLEDLVSQLSVLSADVQALRGQADQEIAVTVNEVNTALDEIDQLNDAIRQAEAAGQPTADLEDQRQEAVNTVASAMSISTFTAANGNLCVYTLDGTPLVDSSVHHLEFQDANTVTADSTIGSGLAGIAVEGKDITDELRNGSLEALLEQRDETLPAVQEELDALAVALIDGINASHSAGTAAPAPDELTGNIALSGADPVTATGTLRVVVTDGDGTAQSVADIDLSTITTVADLVTALDGVPGLDASLDADGYLSLTTTTAGTGVALNAANTDMGTGNTLTQEYGINTILTGTGADDIALVGWLDDDPGLLAVATVSDDPTLTVGDNAVAAGDSSGVDRMLAVFTEEVSFAEAGHLSATETTLGGYAGDIMGGASVRLDSAETASITANAVLGTLEARMSSETGVNLDEETARLEELQSSYEAAATLMSVVSEMFDSLISAVN